MPGSVVCYTCIIGSFDYLRSPTIIEPGVRYICYSDVPRDPCPPWEIQPAYTPYGIGSRDSRIPKILPHLHFDADYSLYLDANFVLREAPSTLIHAYLEGPDRMMPRADIAMFGHPCRQHVGQEASVLHELHGKGELPGLDGPVLDAQVTRWKHMGAPMGLWAGGFILRRHTPRVQDLNEYWWREFSQGCSRDQIALPMAKHIAIANINRIPGNIYECAPLAMHWHAAWRGKYTNAQYETRQAELDAQRARLKEMCR